MARGRTLWEMFSDWLSGPRELQQFNPLKAKMGSSVTIDDVEWRNRDFLLTEFRVYRRMVEGQEFLFADYVLTERSTKGEETTIRIRLNPTAEAHHTGQEHHALLLFLEEDMAYDEGLHGVLQDPSGLFRIEHDGKVTAEFTRLHGLRAPYITAVTVLTDDDHNKRVDRDEVKEIRLEYWDFERDVPDAAGNPEKEYLFAELDAKDGWFQIWRGREFDARRITTI